MALVAGAEGFWPLLQLKYMKSNTKQHISTRHKYAHVCCVVVKFFSGSACAIQDSDALHLSFGLGDNGERFPVGIDEDLFWLGVIGKSFPDVLGHCTKGLGEGTMRVGASGVDVFQPRAFTHRCAFPISSSRFKTEKDRLTCTLKIDLLSLR